jgi:PIN domain
MFRVLIDTCVWLDLAKDQRQEGLLAAVEEMVRLGMISLIVHQTVLDEFQRNRERIAKESARSVSTHVRVVKDAVGKVGGNKRRMRLVLTYLDDVDHKMPIIGGTAVGTLDRIEKLLKGSRIVEASDAARLRAAQRAMEKRAPFHRDKNAMADAIIIETYADCVRDKTEAGVRFAFITHNKNDFSVQAGNQKMPHQDFAGMFSRIKSLYFINLAEALRRVDPSVVTDVMLEHSWSQDPRGLAEILEAEDLLFHQVWYNRHWNSRIGVEKGTIKLVDKETYPARVAHQRRSSGTCGKER